MCFLLPFEVKAGSGGRLLVQKALDSGDNDRRMTFKVLEGINIGSQEDLKRIAKLTVCEIG
jgi:hypothetical protein